MKRSLKRSSIWQLLLSTAFILEGAFSAAPLQAQTTPPPSLVNACTGIKLPKSAITSTMDPVIRGVVTPLQTSLNTLFNVLSPLRVNINVDTLLANAAAGDPISLQMFTTDGRLLTSSDDCNLQTDSYSLAESSGISIGGNSITGLGGINRATSGEINSIAFGNGSITAANAFGSLALGTNAKVGDGAVGGVALGQGASVFAAHGVAIGDGATVTRGPLAGYTDRRDQWRSAIPDQHRRRPQYGCRGNAPHGSGCADRSNR